MKLYNDLKYLEKFAKKLEIEPNRFSCLKISLHDARLISGSNLETGQFNYNILESNNHFLSPYSFICVINYLLVLEIIGSVFNLKSTKTNKKNNIFRALHQFSTLPNQDIDIIISLRNSLAHNYGLVNIPLNSKENKTKRHKFSLLNTEDAKLIQYPATPWDGDFKNKSDDVYTKIGVHKLINLVEEVYSNVISSIENKKINIALIGGIDELNARFTISH